MVHQKGPVMLQAMAWMDVNYFVVVVAIILYSKRRKPNANVSLFGAAKLFVKSVLLMKRSTYATNSSTGKPQYLWPVS